jgi:hypothetical protein
MAWRIQEDFRIGSAEGSGPDVFGEVRDIEVDAAGRIYVLDHQARAIRVFDRNGRYVRSLGREGEGPGEFRTPTGMALGPDQRLWVADTRTARFTVFDTSGALAATYPRLAQAYGWAWDGGISRAGQLVDPTRISVGNERRQGLLLYDSAGSVFDTLPLPVVPELYWELEGGSGAQRFLTFIQVPFTPTLAWRYDPAGAVWVANTARYALYRVSLRGDTTFGLIREHQPVRVTAEDRERAIAGILGSMQVPAGRLDPGRMPDFHPAIMGFVLDDRGYVWVQPRGPSGFDVFDDAGRYLGNVAMPTRGWRLAPVPLIRGAHLYYLDTDSLDVPYVVRARIVGRN